VFAKFCIFFKNHIKKPKNEVHSEKFLNSVNSGSDNYYITPDMSIPTPEIRLAILFAAAFAIVLFLAVIIIMHSLGNMENHLKRMQFIISKEIILRYNQQVNYYKQQRQRFIAQQERDKRQEALLEIPLVRNSEHNLKDKL